MKLLLKITILSLLIIPFSVSASFNFDELSKQMDKYFNSYSDGDTLIFENQVNASSNTGNNIGATSEGKSKSSVEVKTTINGQELENLNITNTSSSPDQEINYNSTINVNGDKAKIEAVKKVDGKVQRETKEIKLETQDKVDINNDLEKYNSSISGNIKNDIEINTSATGEMDGMDINNQNNNSKSTSLGQEEESGNKTTSQENISPLLGLINTILDIFIDNINRIAALF